MSDDTEEAAIDQLAADLADPIIEALSQDVLRLRAENAKFRQALEVIQYTLKQGFGDQVMLNRIANTVVEALAAPGEGGGACR